MFQVIKEGRFVIIPGNGRDKSLCEQMADLEQAIHNVYWGETIDTDYELIPSLHLPDPETTALTAPELQ